MKKRLLKKLSSQKYKQKIPLSLFSLHTTTMYTLQNQITSIKEAFQPFYDNLTTVFQNITIGITPIVSQFKINIDSAMTRLQESSTKYAVLLPKVGWVLPMNLNPTEIDEIVGYSTNLLKIDNALYNFFIKDNNYELNMIFDDLQNDPNLSQWKTLLIDCIDVFNKKHYIVTIPALISIIEGLIVSKGFEDSILKYYKPRKDQNTTNITSISKKIYNNCKNKFGKNFIPICVWLSISKFIAQLYSGGEFSDPTKKPKNINRQYILHGRISADTWTENDAIRLFVCIHTLASTFDWQK
jgi:hypothetical protein